MIRNELLEKFKRLYRSKYHIELSDEEAIELATHFIDLMDVLIHPKQHTTHDTNTTEHVHYEINQL